MKFCEDLRSRWKELITILALEVIPPEKMGFLIAEMEPSAQSSSSGGMPKCRSGRGRCAPKRRGGGRYYG